MEKGNDIYIETIRYAKTKLGNGILIQGLVDHLNNIGYKNISVHSNLLHYIVVQNFTLASGKAIFRVEVNNRQKYYLSSHSYFHLLEYDELQQARSDSKMARMEAKTATYIAVATLIISTLMSLISIFYG